MKHHPLLLLSCVAVSSVCILLNEVQAEDRTKQSVEPSKGVPMKIRIKVEGRTLTATLDDNATARDFVAMLPLTLTLKDYNRAEKISDLPKKLSIQGAPSGSDPTVGDISYYAAWGNIAIFYRDFGYSTGLVKIGKTDGDVDALSGAQATQAAIELIKE